VALLGIDAPAIVSSSNQVVPVAGAVSLRLAPGDNAAAATETLIAYLKDAAWGSRCRSRNGGSMQAQSYMVDSAPALG
jgi:hypothetical protein